MERRARTRRMWGRSARSVELLSLSVTDRSMIPRRSRRLARDADEVDAIPVSLPSGSWSRSIVVNETGWLHMRPSTLYTPAVVENDCIINVDPCARSRKSRGHVDDRQIEHILARAAREGHRTSRPLPPYRTEDGPREGRHPGSSRRGEPKAVFGHLNALPIWSLRSFA